MMQKKISLSPLEQDIMAVIWDHPGCHVRRVYTELAQNREIAYTTVMTMMNRLVEKGVLKREKSANKFLYLPLASRKQAAKGFLENFFSTMFDQYGQDGVTAFAEEVERLPKEKREQLKRMLEDEA